MLFARVRRRGANRQKQAGSYAGRAASGGVQLLPDRLNPAADRAFIRRFAFGRIGDEPFLHFDDQIAFGLYGSTAALVTTLTLAATVNCIGIGFQRGTQARSLYAEMARNLSTRTKPDGGALASVVERFVSQAHRDAETSDVPTGSVIRERLGHFEELTGGFEFAEVVRRYWEGHETGDEDLKSAALRWLRGEFVTRTDARKALGVRTIIDDASVYDHLKLMSAFVREAGYKGLLVGIDEMVNLYKLTSSQARNANYEQILRILNDVLQGSAENLGFLLGGTPEFLMNTRRGLYSYEALQSRLAENTFARDGLVDLSGPVIRLASLTPEDLFVLLSNVRKVMQLENEALPDEALEAFMAHCSDRIGEAYFRTPRNTVTAFVNLLSILEQNPGVEWSDLIEKIEVAEDRGEDLEEVGEAIGAQSSGDDDLVSFKL